MLAAAEGIAVGAGRAKAQFPMISFGALALEDAFGQDQHFCAVWSKFRDLGS